MSDRGSADVGRVVPPGTVGRPTETDAVLTPDVEPAVPAGQTLPPSSAGAPEGGESKAAEAKGAAKQEASRAAGEAKDVADNAKQQTQEVAATASEGAKDVAHEASEQLHHVAQEATNQAGELFNQAASELRAQANTQTDRAAGGLHTLAAQLGALANGRPEEAGQVADYARQLNDKVEQLASRIEQRGPDGILEDVQGFARRRPGVFLAGAAAAGFVVSRLVRGNQAADSQPDQTRRDVGAGGGRSDIDLRPGDVVDQRELDGAPLGAAPLSPEVDARRQYGSV